MEVKKVFENKSSKQKLVIIPKNSDIEVGDYVQIIKLEEKGDSE